MNLQTKLALVHYSGESSAGAQVQVDMVVGEDAIYLRSPQFRGKLPEGKEWTKMDPSLATDEDLVPAESPDGSLGMLSVSDRVHLAGHAQVHGVQVSRYVTSFEMSEAAAELRAKGEDQLAEKCEKLSSRVAGPVRAEAFVDGKGLVRRIHIRLTSTASGEDRIDDGLLRLRLPSRHPGPAGKPCLRHDAGAQAAAGSARAEQLIPTGLKMPPWRDGLAHPRLPPTARSFEPTAGG